MNGRAPVAFPIFDASKKTLKYSTVVSERANLPFVIGGKSGSVDRESGAGKALDLIRPDPYTLGFQLLSCQLGPNGAATGTFAAVNALNVAPLAVTSGGDSDGIACVLALAHPSIPVDPDLPTVFVSCSIANQPGRVVGVENIEIGQVTKRGGNPTSSLFSKWMTVNAFSRNSNAILVLHLGDAQILSTHPEFTGTVISIDDALIKGLTMVSLDGPIVVSVGPTDIRKLLDLIYGAPIDDMIINYCRHVLQRSRQLDGLLSLSACIVDDSFDTISAPINRGPLSNHIRILLENESWVLLVGERGSGKTTSLKQIERDSAQKTLGSYDPSTIDTTAFLSVPVVLDLALFNGPDYSITSVASLRELFERDLSNSFRRVAEPPNYLTTDAGLLRAIVARRGLLILADGLNQMSDKGDKALQALKQLSEDYGTRIKVVIATRRTSCVSPAKYRTLFLLPLDDEQTKQLLTLAELGDQQKASILDLQRRKGSFVADHSRNPYYLVRAIAGLKTQDIFIENEALLLRQVVNDQLERAFPDIELRRQQLRAVCDVSLAIKVLGAAAQRVSLVELMKKEVSGVDWQVVIGTMVSCGFLVEVGDFVRFEHQNLHEYLVAAAYMAHCSRDPFTDLTSIQPGSQGHVQLKALYRRYQDDGEPWDHVISYFVGLSVPDKIWKAQKEEHDPVLKSMLVRALPDGEEKAKVIRALCDVSITRISRLISFPVPDLSTVMLGYFTYILGVVLIHIIGGAINTDISEYSPLHDSIHKILSHSIAGLVWPIPDKCGCRELPLVARLYIQFVNMFVLPLALFLIAEAIRGRIADRTSKWLVVLTLLGRSEDLSLGGRHLSSIQRAFKDDPEVTLLLESLSIRIQPVDEGLLARQVSDPLLKQRAVSLLGSFGTKSSIDALLQALLSEESAESKKRIINTLLRIGNRHAETRISISQACETAMSCGRLPLDVTFQLVRILRRWDTPSLLSFGRAMWSTIVGFIRSVFWFFAALWLLLGLSTPLIYNVGLYIWLIIQIFLGSSVFTIFTSYWMGLIFFGVFFITLLVGFQPTVRNGLLRCPFPVTLLTLLPDFVHYPLVPVYFLARKIVPPSVHSFWIEQVLCWFHMLHRRPEECELSFQRIMRDSTTLFGRTWISIWAMSCTGLAYFRINDKELSQQWFSRALALCRNRWELSVLVNRYPSILSTMPFLPMSVRAQYKDLSQWLEKSFDKQISPLPQTGFIGVAAIYVLVGWFASISLSILGDVVYMSSSVKWVSSSQSILFAKTETTVEQYRHCIAAGACSKPEEIEEEGGECTYRPFEIKMWLPINCVTFEQARKFCQWIGGRLPTRDEYQKEVKSLKGAGKRGRYFDAGYTVLPQRVCSIKGQRDANYKGACDLRGNLWEYVENPAGKTGLTCGGGFRDKYDEKAPICSKPKHDAYFTVGFRCVREP